MRVAREYWLCVVKWQVRGEFIDFEGSRRRRSPESQLMREHNAGDAGSDAGIRCSGKMQHVASGEGAVRGGGWYGREQQ